MRRVIGRTALAIITFLTMVTSIVSATSAPAAAAGNACTNPVLASNLNGWGSLDGASVSRDPVGDLPGANWAFDTSGHEFYMPQLSVTAGQSWTFSARDAVVFGSGTAKIEVDWYGPSGNYLSSAGGPTVTLPASTVDHGTWIAVSATFTVPNGAASVHVLQTGNFGNATGTDFKATMCDYELNTAGTSDVASVRYNWGTAVASQSDEYNGTSVDLNKWVLFGTDPGESTGCYSGFNGHGLRCASQTTEAGGYLSVTGTADGTTGGLAARTRPFKYGRVEVRERAVPLSDNGGHAWHAVPLMWPKDDADWANSEIDFAERDVADPSLDLFVHHDGTQSQCTWHGDSTQFHNYAVDWEPTSVAWYVDAVKICTVNVSINYYEVTNGGAQMDMIPASGTLMRPARQDVDWIHMFTAPATLYF
ncbi:glycoside hydrolase family 16 protein [Actinoplanes sp. NPDC051411]|uniref:glycoside hydrolase family 16 protein n=1 Tax=Actinoplanes sp. NPDC051411 TaxID=3155522 RepID=UPI003435084A